MTPNSNRHPLFFTHFLMLSLLLLSFFLTSASSQSSPLSAFLLNNSIRDNDTCVDIINPNQNEAAPDDSNPIHGFEPIVSKTPELNDETQQILSRINERKAVRVSRIDEEKPVLMNSPDEIGTDLNLGIKRLFAREIIHSAVEAAQKQLMQTVAKWSGPLREQVDRDRLASEQARGVKSGGNSDISRDSEGIYRTLFIEKYMPLATQLMKEKAEIAKARGQEFTPPNFRFMGLKQQEGYVRELVVAHVSGKDEMRRKYAARIKEEVQAIVDDIVLRYDRNIDAEPNVSRVEQKMLSIFDDMIRTLSTEYFLSLDQFDADRAEFAAVVDKSLNQIVNVAEGADKHRRVTLQRKGAMATYHPHIGTLVLTPSEQAIKAIKPESLMITSLFFHGAGTNKSNVASWLNLISLFSAHGVFPFAFDMRGSIGNRGVAFNDVGDPKEMGLYIETLARASRGQLPVQILGRSTGASFSFAQAVASKRLHISSAVDSLQLMSFSNPLTMEDQTLNVYDQLARGEIFGVVTESLDMATEFDLGIMALLNSIKQTDPDFFNTFGDEMVFIQGEADEDGAPRDGSGKTVVDVLVDFRDTYAPMGHVYILPDPLAEFRKKGLLKGIKPDQQEATHHLYSNYANLPNKRDGRGVYPDDIPDLYLPKFYDQLIEVLAVHFATLDYRIDLSPLTEESRRTQMREQRQQLTKSDSSFAYLNWFIENAINPKRVANGEKPIELSKLIKNTHIRTTREFGLRGRIKKVYRFFVNEQKRVQKKLDKLNKVENKNKAQTQKVQKD